MDNNIVLPATFRKKSPAERLTMMRKAILSSPQLSDESNSAHQSEQKDTLEEKLIHIENTLLLPNTIVSDMSNTMIESAIGGIMIPIGIVKNVKVNGQIVHIPIATEEASVISAASYAATILSNATKKQNKEQHSHGIVAKSSPALQIAQISLEQVNAQGEQSLTEQWSRIQTTLMSLLSKMHKRGGGLRGSQFRRLLSGLVVFQFTVDVRDAMGANIVNSAAEAIAPLLEEITGGHTLAAILSNYSEERTANAHFILEEKYLPATHIPSHLAAQKIAHMSLWAKEDMFRAVTHNKGIMNGISGLALATGNDTRAFEAATHALATSKAVDPHYYSSYSPLSHFDYSEGQLKAELEIPALLATVGGATSHPVAQWSFRVLSINSNKAIQSHQLNCIAAALGLAQNFAALFALVSTGIQHGHLQYHHKKLHTKSPLL